jgi:recombination protein RecA
MSTTIIFLNQIRMKIGVMFGNPETTTGGNALKFYSSLRIEIRKGNKIESGTGDAKEASGNAAKIKVVKNKVAAPFKTAEVDIIFNEGISHMGDLLDTAEKMGIIEKSGAFYSFTALLGKSKAVTPTKLGQGRLNAVDFLKANPKLAAEIENLVRTKAGL